VTNPWDRPLIKLPDNWRGTHEILFNEARWSSPIDWNGRVLVISAYCRKCQMGWFSQMTLSRLETMEETRERLEQLVREKIHVAFENTVQGMRSLPCDRAALRAYNRHRRRHGARY